MSFAGLAQAHRHRTISYELTSEPKLGAPEGLYIPQIIINSENVGEWLSDLEEISKTDFPQAQMVGVAERGRIEDFRSKMLLRLCGHAQREIMRNTDYVAGKYAGSRPIVSDWMKPKCQQGMRCGGCVWTGKNALSRLV